MLYVSRNRTLRVVALNARTGSTAWSAAAAASDNTPDRRRLRRLARSRKHIRVRLRSLPRRQSLGLEQRERSAGEGAVGRSPVARDGHGRCAYKRAATRWLSPRTRDVGRIRSRKRAHTLEVRRRAPCRLDHVVPATAPARDEYDRAARSRQQARRSRSRHREASPRLAHEPRTGQATVTTLCNRKS